MSGSGFTDGIYFVPLAGIDHTSNRAHEIDLTIAEAIGLEFQGSADVRTQLLTYLRSKKVLLILDNFEHLLTDDETTPALDLMVSTLQSSPDVKMLITSRQRLNLQDEWSVTLDGIEYPESANASREELAASPAVQLFIHCAAKADTGFGAMLPAGTVHTNGVTQGIEPTRDSHEIDHIARICRLVEGVPLAIELAAGWVYTLTCQEIVEEIETSLDFLATTLHDVPQRHRSLRAVFEQTWRRLHVYEQEALRGLVVFRGGCTREAAAQIAGVSLPMLARLTDKSLLRRAQRAGEQRRYDMHGLLHRFISEKAQEIPGESARNERKWCHYFAAALAALESDFVNERQVEAYAWMRQEILNLHAAWEYAYREEPIAVIEKFVDGMGNYYTTRAQYQQGLHFMTEALERLATVDVTKETVEKRVHRAHCKALNWRSVFYITLREPTAAEQDLRVCVDLARAIDAPEYLAAALGWLAAIAAERRHFSSAQELAQEGLQIARAADLPNLEARLLIRQADASTGTYDYATAQALLLEALDIHRRQGDHFYVDLTLGSLATVLQARGEFGRAKELLLKGLEKQEQIGSRHRRHELYNHLAESSLALGEYAQARHYYEMSTSFCQERKLIGQQSCGVFGLGRIARIEGHTGIAREYLEQSLAIFQKADLPEETAANLEQLGRVALTDGDTQIAQERFERSRELYEQLQRSNGIALALSGLAQVAQANGELDESRKIYIEAVTLLPPDAKPIQAEILAHFVENLILSGEMTAGKQLLCAVVQQSNITAETHSFAYDIRSKYALLGQPPNQSNGKPDLNAVVAGILEEIS